jgi:hypothetical protein
MRAYIKKLQAKDEIVRKQIFFGLMVVSMAFVGFIWIYNLGDRFDSKVKEQVREDVKPFKLFANSLSSTYQNISASVGNISTPKKAEQKVKEVEEQKQVNLIVVEEVPSQ